MGALSCPVIPVATIALSALAALASCYSPELRECAVMCTSSEDCGPDQECSPDGWCSGSGRAGRCRGSSAGDGGPPDKESRLRVVIVGQGEVEVIASSASLQGTCVSTKAIGATCEYPVPPEIWVVLRKDDGGGWQFSGWEAPGCTTGRPNSCLVRTEKGAIVVVVARFFDSKLGN